MGNNYTTDQVPPNISEMCRKTDFAPSEIRKIYANFLSFDTLKKGYVSTGDLRKLKEIYQNPLKQNILNYLTQNTKKEEEVNFELFIYMLDVFENKKIHDHKRFLFDICDTNHDGEISTNDFYNIFEFLLGNEFNREDIKDICSKVLQDNFSSKGLITFDEFLRIID